MAEKPTPEESATTITPGMKVRSRHWDPEDDEDTMTVVHVHNGKAWVEGKGWNPHLRDVDVLVPAPLKFEVGRWYQYANGRKKKCVAIDGNSAWLRVGDDAHDTISQVHRNMWTEVPADA